MAGMVGARCGGGVVYRPLRSAECWEEKGVVKSWEIRNFISRTISPVSVTRTSGRSTDFVHLIFSSVGARTFASMSTEPAMSFMAFCSRVPVFVRVDNWCWPCFTGAGYTDEMLLVCHALQVCRKSQGRSDRRTFGKHLEWRTTQDRLRERVRWLRWGWKG